MGNAFLVRPSLREWSLKCLTYKTQIKSKTQATGHFSKQQKNIHIFCCYFGLIPLIVCAQPIFFPRLVKINKSENPSSIHPL